MAYATAGEIIGRAAVQCGILTLSPSQIAAFDPYAQTEQGVVLMVDLLRTLGDELASQVKAHLQAEGSILTAGAATSYDLPVDFGEFMDDTGWERGTGQRLFGPVTPQYEHYLKAWMSGAQVDLPYRLQGLRITFPVDPGDGRTINFGYVSRYWARASGSTAPGTKAYPEARTDVVLFDAALCVLGLKLAYLEAKGFDTTSALALYQRRLEHVKGAVAGGPTLSLNGPSSEPALGPAAVSIVATTFDVPLYE